MAISKYTTGATASNNEELDRVTGGPFPCGFLMREMVEEALESNYFPWNIITTTYCNKKSDVIQFASHIDVSQSAS